MDTLTTSAAELNESFTKAVGAFQSQLLSVHREAAAAITKLQTETPDMPSWVPATDPASSVSASADLVKQAFDFSAERLESNRKFVLDVFDAWTVKPARKSAAKS